MLYENSHDLPLLRRKNHQVHDPGALPQRQRADLSVRQLQRLCRLLPRRKPNGESSQHGPALKRQETHRIFDRFWREQGWTRSAAYRWLAQNLHLKEHETHIGMMEMDECEQVIRLCRKYGKHKKEAA